MFGISGADLLGWLLFGLIGMVAWGWAKLKERWQPFVLGAALMVFPYFIPGGFWMWAVGSVLTGLIFFARQ